MAKRASKTSTRKSASKGRVKAKAPPNRRGRKSKTAKNLVPIKPGNPDRIGRKKGTPNKFTVKLKEAILEAAERSGRNGKGKDGAVGYLVWLSRAEPAVFGRMLEKIMPMQLDVRDKTDRAMTAQEAVERLKERGLPVPETLNSLARSVGAAVAERQEEDYEAELNGEGDDAEAVEPGEDDDDDEAEAA